MAYRSGTTAARHTLELGRISVTAFLPEQFVVFCFGERSLVHETLRAHKIFLASRYPQFLWISLWMTRSFLSNPFSLLALLLGLLKYSASCHRSATKQKVRKNIFVPNRATVLTAILAGQRTPGEKQQLGRGIEGHAIRTMATEAATSDKPATIIVGASRRGRFPAPWRVVPG